MICHWVALDILFADGLRKWYSLKFLYEAKSDKEVTVRDARVYSK